MISLTHIDTAAPIAKLELSTRYGQALVNSQLTSKAIVSEVIISSTNSGGLYCVEKTKERHQKFKILIANGLLFVVRC